METTVRGWGDPYSIEKRRNGHVFGHLYRRRFRNRILDDHFELKFNNRWRGKLLKDIYNDIEGIFDNFLQHLRRNGVRPTDLVRIRIKHQDLKGGDIFVRLQAMKDLNSDVILSRFQQVVQSNQSVQLDQSFNIVAGIVNMPVGGGGGTKITSLREDAENSVHKKQSMVKIGKDGVLCLSRALVVCKAHLDMNKGEITKSRYKVLCDKRNCSIQRKEAIALQTKAGLPIDKPCAITDIMSFHQILQCDIVVFDTKEVIFSTGSNSNDQLYLFYSEYEGEGHFDAITSPAGCLGRNRYCKLCMKVYQHISRHKCRQDVCTICKSLCDPSSEIITCEDCHAKCKSKTCYDTHKKTGEKGGKSICQSVWYCPECRGKIVREKTDPKHHVCGEYFCKNCNRLVEGVGHVCYMTSTPSKPPKSRFIFFDFESMLIENEHKVNLTVSHSCCEFCLQRDIVDEDSKCTRCGYRCLRCDKWSQKKQSYVNPPCEECVSSGHANRRQMVFKSSEAFCRFLFRPVHQNYIVFAHNAGRYDHIFLLNYVINNGLAREVIYRGSRIVMAYIKPFGIKLMDSLNFLPGALATLPESWDLKERCKGYFPHKANIEKYQKYVGPMLPSHFYGPDQMSTKGRKDFMEWYNQQKDREFHFQNELLAYCISDVHILREAILKFRHLMLTVTGGTSYVDEHGGVKWRGSPVDPFAKCTIAGTCMNVFRTKFLQEELRVVTQNEYDNAQQQKRPARTTTAFRKGGETRVLVDGQYLHDVQTVKEKEVFVRSPIMQTTSSGVINQDRYSKMAILWLEGIMWKSRRDGNPIFIQHALNGGEYRIPHTNYKSDGFIKESNSLIEIYGCHFHSCVRCNPDREKVHPTSGKTMETIYQETLRREKILKDLGYTVLSHWEHDFQDFLDSDPDLREYLNCLDIPERLCPREGFHGGRTNAVRLHYETRPGERIEYVDFCSMYPWVLKTCKFMTYEPEIITRDFDPDINTYFGFVLCKVLPPRGLYHPILPRVSGGKLKFTLCAKCGDEENQETCRCSDEDRALVGVFCTPELHKAVNDLGYRILKIYEIYHFPDTSQYSSETKSGGLFTEYVNTFLKLKQESSGWPAWCETDEKKQEYIDQYFEHEGILLESDKIKDNPGLRSLAKLCLNSYWGRLAMDDNLTQSKFISQESELIQMITDPTIEVQNFHILNENTALVEYKHAREWIPPSPVNNVYIAAFTTSWARLRLYEVLELMGRSILYMDTDSAIYIHRPGDEKPLLGDFLGDLTSELKPGRYITHFVSGGPKNYAYREDNGSETCKVKGFTLNYQNSLKINFKSMKGLVTSSGKEKSITIENPANICRDKFKNIVYNQSEDKKYSIVYTKRQLKDDLTTLPYGY